VPISVKSGPPVSVIRMIRPSPQLSVTTRPATPFVVRAGLARTVTVIPHVTQCETVPRNAGPPFLDVTLRNTQAIQQQSFILGPRYARDLDAAIEDVRDRHSRSSPKPPRHLNEDPRVLRLR